MPETPGAALRSIEGEAMSDSGVGSPSEFRAHINAVRREVDGWPAHKRNMFGPLPKRKEEAVSDEYRRGLEGTLRRNCARDGISGVAVWLMVLNSRAGQPADALWRVLRARARGHMTEYDREVLTERIGAIRSKKPPRALGLDMSREARERRANLESDKWNERTNYIAQAPY